MLLPEPNRSRLPFVASLTVQCSLVLLLAIPWTVQTLRNRTSIQLPILLNPQTLKPVHPTKTMQTHSATDNSLSVPTRQTRIFQPPLAKSDNSNIEPLSPAPELTFDSGRPIGFGEAAHVSDVLVRTGLEPAVSPSITFRRRFF